jgi:hypothetical protein
MMLRNALFASVVAILLATAVGCGGSTTCDKFPKCNEPGVLICSTDKKTVLECGKNQDGCQTWIEDTACIGAQTCQATDNGAACVCNDACAAGASRCQGSVIETCATVQGCLAWSAGTDCADTGKACAVVNGTAQCTDVCQSDCTRENATRCHNGTVQTCTQNGTCLNWQDTTTCTGRKQCVEDANGAACVCQDSCADGDSQCSGTKIQTCGKDADNCRIWTDGEDCASSSKVCAIVNGDAVCQDTCQSDCTTLNATQCHGNDIQTCQQNDSCLNWAVTGSCTGRQVCDATSGTASCVCQDACSAGQSACDGTVIQNCTQDSQNCYYYVAGTDCAATSQVCEVVNNTAQCVTPCQSDCPTLNATRCMGNVVQTCTQNGTCLNWADTTTCAVHQKCDEANGAASCVCDNVCDANATRCQGTLIQACTEDDNQCRYWLDGTDCAATQQACVETGGAHCETTCQSDCTTLDATQCAGNTVQTCLQNGVCLNWTTTDTCGAREVCNGNVTPAVCECQNECSAGAGRCTGEVPETCTADGDGCYYWSAGTSCADTNQICILDGNGLPTCVTNCATILQDGSFEVGTPPWVQVSNNFNDLVICDSSCGIDAALTGVQYVWMGGVGTTGTFPEITSISQSVVLPSGLPATLFFWLALLPGNPQAPTDAFEVKVDGNVVLSIQMQNAGTYLNQFGLVTVDLSAYADGATHIISLGGTITVPFESFLIDEANLKIGNSCCADLCFQNGLSACAGDQILTCAPAANGCLDIQLVQDCSTNNPPQTCADPGTGPVCADIVYGVNCDRPYSPSATIPAGLPMTIANQTTCGMVDDYADTCLGSYDGAEDMVFRFEVTEASIVRFTLDPKGTAYTGMALSATCPLGNNCLMTRTSTGGTAFGSGCTSLPTGTYYLMVDDYPPPNCIPSFDLTVEACNCATGQTQCLDANTLQTCDANGQWVDSTCTGGCQIFGGVAQCVNPGNTCQQALPMPLVGGQASLQLDNTNMSDTYANYTSCTTSRTGKDVWTSFTLIEPAHVVITTSDPGTVTDTVLAILDACGGTQLACNDDIGGGINFSMIETDLAPGTYFLVSEPYTSTASGTWTINVTATYNHTAVRWTFEDATGTGTLIPAIGTGTAVAGSGIVANSFTTGYGGGSSKAWHSSSWTPSATGPTANDYFELSTSLTGFTSAPTVGFFAYRSSTGPNAFEVHYSIDGTNYLPVPNSVSSIPAASTWTGFAFDLSNMMVPVENAATVSFRIMAYGATGESGTLRIDDFYVRGNP